MYSNKSVYNNANFSEFCLYNEVRYELNSKWKMQVDGVTYDCECNDKGKLRCSYQSQKTLVKVCYI